jgi:cell division protease FtsH
MIQYLNSSFRNTSFTPRATLLRRGAYTLFLSVVLLALTPFASSSAASETTGSTAGKETTSATTQAKVADESAMERVWVRDENGVPYIEEVAESSYVSEVLARDLLNSEEIKSVFIDENKNKMVLITKGGVLLQMQFEASDVEFLQSMFDSGVVPTFVTFAVAPESVIPGSDKETGENGFDWTALGMIAPFLIIITGIVLIHEKRQRMKREPEADPNTTTFQTREGPGGSIPKVTFADVAGCEEAMEDLSEIVEFLKDPSRFERLGATVPRGAILVGPPGTGKTLLARAVAGEAGVPFFAAAGSDFVEMYVGVGPMRIRELFTKARSEEKAIVFIDEIDAVARSRATSTKQNANDERENTLNALLHELDGFSRGNVILIAATNRVDVLDPAILRPGRLDRKVQVPNPDRRGREAILGIHAEGKPLAKDVDLGIIARRTPGMSGADLAQILNEAAIEAARRNLKSINAACLSSAVALVAMGRARRSALVTDRDRLITAWHEAGHTVCAMKHPDAPNPISVSITPRGHAGGITWMTGSDDMFLARSQASAQLVVAMGGRAAEELLLDGEFTQGPSSDLERATNLASAMVTRYGMTRRGLMVRTGDPDAASHTVIEELLSTALEDARNMLETHRPLMNAIVVQLLEQETLEYNDLLEIEAALEEGANAPSFGERAAHLFQSAGRGVTTVLDEATSKAKGASLRQTSRGRKLEEPTDDISTEAGLSDDLQPASKPRRGANSETKPKGPGAPGSGSSLKRSSNVSKRKENSSRNPKAKLGRETKKGSRVRREPLKDL